jgi:hypothetical protein
LRVEGRRVVLEILDDVVGLGGGKHLLGLAFVNLRAFRHFFFPFPEPNTRLNIVSTWRR